MVVSVCFWAVVLCCTPVVLAEKLQLEVEAARNANELDSALQAFFRQYGVTGHDKETQSLTVVLDAAWRGCFERMASSGEMKENQGPIEEFMNYFAEETGEEIPEIWRDAVETATFKEWFGRCQVEFDSIPRRFSRSDAFWYCEKGLSVRLSESEVVVESGSTSVSLPACIVEYAKKAFPSACISVARGGKGNEIVLVEGILVGGGNGKLFSIDGKSGQVAWESDVFGGLALAGGTNGISHVSYLIRNETSISVYGFGQAAAFAESFDLRTGENLWRFSTSYWSSNTPRK